MADAVRSLAQPRPARDHLAPGFAVYVHWPFCVSKCPYCDFNSHVRASIDETGWCRALLAEIDHFAAMTEGREVTSIFFGGGTPSLMSPASTAAIIGRIAEHWAVAPDIEITLEANPSSVEACRFRGFRAAGVNRLSLGVQSLEPDSLRFLGRAHGREEALAAIRLAQKSFERMSFDLIYARPGQTPESWRRELDEALDLAAGHLSLYQLTIEAGTAFHTAYGRGDFVLPDDELGGELYEMTQAHLARAGLPAYEISNHARPGEESHHNLNYWRYGDYAGVGPGAHGRLSLPGGKTAFRQKKTPESWIAAVKAQGHGTEETQTLGPEDRITEFLMMGLRLAEGIPRSRFLSELGQEAEELLDMRQVGLLVSGGFIVLDGKGLTATAAGRQRLNAVLTRLLP